MYTDEHGQLVNGIKEVRYSHDAMIDLLIARPQISQGEVATFFGYTQGWVSTILSSDAFQARMAQRKSELVDPLLIKSLEERFRAVAQLSLDKIQERLASNKASETFLIASARLGADALGYGGKAQTAGSGGPSVVINMPGVAPSAQAWSAQYAGTGAPPDQSRDARPANLVIDHERPDGS